MSVIYVRGVVGRQARTSKRGQPIPMEDFVPVVPSNYIERLIANGDVEMLEGQPKPRGKSKATKPPVATDTE